LVGEPGCGKSTFLKSFVDPLDPSTDSSMYKNLARETETMDNNDDVDDTNSSNINNNNNNNNEFKDLGSFEWLSDNNNMIVSRKAVCVYDGRVLCMH
jgi:ABC-type dipeptide/oligopeptide/nickel transport system ATPase component